jgi:ParB family transcriptional regulator, chromosome partitioning protein
MSTKQKGLGRGLAALLGNDSNAPSPAPPPTTIAAPLTLRLDQMRAGRYQPRTRMDETALMELAQSLTTHGMMQPILVRPIQNTDTSSSLSGSPGAAAAPSSSVRYEIIAGERRFRAAKLAGFDEVPIIIRDVPDEQALALALIENIQREDLNPLEEAQAIKRLIDEFNYSHEQASHAIGRSRSATSNLLRLLNLAESVQTMLVAGDLDMGHARALLPLDRATQTMLANEVVQRRLSVRETERLVAKSQANDANATPGGRTHANAKSSRAPGADQELRRLQERLSDALQTEVQIHPGPKGSGKLVIAFSSLENFEGLMERIGLQLEDLA